MGTVERIGHALQLCLEAHPVVDGEIPAEAKPLTELYGRAIFAKGQGEKGVDASEVEIRALEKWSALDATPAKMGKDT